jgi:hypothetical protein
VEHDPLAAVPIELVGFSVTGSSGIRVRAELDAAPVDFSAVELGAVVERA